jgi:hypothetical protein
MSSCLGGSASVLLSDAYGVRAPESSFGELLRTHAVCIATTGGGCDAVDACLGIELDVPGDCTPGCDGEVAVLCGAGHVRWRCADLGLACIDGVCAVSGAACSDDACAGSSPVRCLMGTAQTGPDCTAFDSTCATPTGPSACVGRGEACTETASTTNTIDFFDNGVECVDGDTLAACINGGRAEVACDALAPGTTCRTTSEVMPRAFCGRGNACNPFTTVVEFCSGNDIAVCNAGRLQTVRCLDLGFSGCTTGRCN